MKDKQHTEDERARASDQSDKLCFLQMRAMSDIGRTLKQPTTYQRHRNNQNRHNEIHTHKDIIQPSNRRIQISHRILDTQLLAMELQARHLQLVAIDITVRVLVEDRKGCVGFVGVREEPGDVFDDEEFGAGAGEGVEETAGELGAVYERQSL